MRLGAVVAVHVADEHVQRDEAFFRPGMDGNVGFGQDDHAGDAAGSAELVEALPHRRQAAGIHQIEAEGAQRLDFPQQTVRPAAAVKIAHQVQAVNAVDWFHDGWIIAALYG